MPEPTLEEKLIETFDTLADTLLVDGDGQLEVIASTSEASRLVEVMQLSAQAGPCIDWFRSGAVVSQPDISARPARWSQVAREALAQGFASVYAIPMGLKDTTIGTLNLLRSTVGELDPSDVLASQALAAVASGDRTREGRVGSHPRGPRWTRHSRSFAHTPALTG